MAASTYPLDANGTARPFDGIADLPGEVEIWPTFDGIGEACSEASADVIDAAYSKTTCPVIVSITNYRLKIYEPTVAGATLAVTLCSGNNLKAMDPNGYSDPFALLYLNGPTHRSLLRAKVSSTQSKTLDPVWNQTFIFEGVLPEHGLRVELFDEDPGKKSDPLGYVDIPCIAQRNAEPHADDPSTHSQQWSKTFPVMEGQGRGQGTVQLRIRCAWYRPEVDLVSRHCSIPLLSIEDVKGEEETIDVVTKTARKITLRFDERDSAQQVKRILVSHPCNNKKIFCLQAPPKAQGKREHFDWHAVLHRLTSLSQSGYSSRWRVESKLNEAYGACDTYPTEFIVPASLSNDNLKNSASFRKINRFTIVSWLHPTNGAMLVRCSQPRTGFSKPEGDGLCLKHFAAESGGLVVCDCRSWATAHVNKFKGGGTETAMQLEGVHQEFFDIGNIHEMRDSLQHLRSGVCQQESHSACSESVSRWCGHLHALLRGAIYVAECIEGGTSAIVHCSDGWDRTSQICSLASLLLDRHYRSIAGLHELVEKDWLQTGHLFKARCGLTCPEEQHREEHEISPIFAQFLDCICQLWMMNPSRFEYTPELLSFLLYHTYSGMYTTFLGNNCKERGEAHLAGRAYSCLWTEINLQRDRWKNPQYEEEGCAKHHPLVPCTMSPHRVQFSEALYGSQCRVWDTERLIGRVRCISMEEHDFGLKVSSKYRKRSVSNPLDGQSGQGNQSARKSSFCASYDSALPLVLKEADQLLTQFLGLPHGFLPENSVEVRSHLEKGDHTAYLIVTTSQSGRAWQTTHRYSEFRTLQEALCKLMKLRPKAPFPPKLWLGRERAGSKKDQRQAELHNWLSEIVQIFVQEGQAAKSS